MKKLFILTVLALGCITANAQNKQDSYTFIGELQYNKDAYLNHRELTTVPYVFFSNKYMLVCTDMDGDARVRDTVFPKELYYDRQSQAVEVRFTVPRSAFTNHKGSVRLLARVIRRDDNAIVGGIKDPISLRIPEAGNPAYINSITFKLPNAIKVGAPAEVSVTTMTDYLREKFTISSDSNDLPRIVASLQGKANSTSVRDYYRLIEFIEPYISNDAFLTREAAEFHDSLAQLRERMANAVVVPGLAQQAQYRESKRLYEDYCLLYEQLKSYYIAAYRKIQSGAPLWFEIGTNVRQDKLMLNGLYGGAFAHTRTRKFAFPYSGPRLSIFLSDTTLNPAQYGTLNKRHWRPGISFFGGMYVATGMGMSSDEPFERYYFSNASVLAVIDSGNNYSIQATSKREAGTVTHSQQLQYATLLLSPRLDLLQRRKGRSAVRLELGLHTELQFQRFTYTTHYSVEASRIDTFYVNDSNTLGSVGYVDSPASTLEKNVDKIAYYFGLELPFEFSNKAFDFLLTPVIGYTNQIPVEATSPVGEARLTPFFAVRATLNEKFLGIGLTGEVKQLLNGAGSPVVSLALIKKINARALVKGALLLGE